MARGLLVRFRPAGPWRFGPDSGARDRAEPLGHSDTIYSAVTAAMLQLGMLDEWLDATARSSGPPAVVLSSCFPFLDDHLLVPPPRHVWPPPPSPKVRWKAARFVPLSVVESLLAGEAVSEERWAADSESECLVPVERGTVRTPFHRALRPAAAVDRMTGSSELHRTACIEFLRGAGMWLAASFANEDAESRWADPLAGAVRLLGDTGIGGERSRGWGHSEQVEITRGEISELFKLRAPGNGSVESETAFWLLSLFHPSEQDAVDWQRGNYALIARGGRVDSPALAGAEKQMLRLVEEGSVLYAQSAPVGRARDVAPEGFPHPVFRSGFALAVPISVRVAS
jgi:CRISPR type III-A-associated RAMP protein Csm4